MLERVRDEVRLRELEPDRDEHEDRPRQQQVLVRPHVFPDAPDQPDVVGLAKNGLGLDALTFARWLGNGRHQLASETMSSVLSSCVLYRSLYTPPASMSSSCLPRSTILPWSSTRI